MSMLPSKGRMESWEKKYLFPVVFLFLMAIFSILIYFFLNQEVVGRDQENFQNDLLKQTIQHQLYKNRVWDEVIGLGEQKYQVNYTFDRNLENFIRNFLKRYRSSYVSVVVLDNRTGKVLAAVDDSAGISISADPKPQGEDTSNTTIANLNFTSTHPAASLFKIISVAAILEKTNLSNTDVLEYKGRGTTLYKYQLMPTNNKWMRKITLEDAFAQSNNVIIGQLAMEYLRPQDLHQMAYRFGFNRENIDFLNVSNSFFPLPTSEFNMAELASGFNTTTLIGPLHGALLSLIMANNGQYKKAYLIDSIIHQETGRTIYQPTPFTEQAISPAIAKMMRGMMETTVQKGTARNSFRKFNRKLKDTIIVGGKTGSMTGGLPYGKRDWFTAYAAPKDDTGPGISICVMIINLKKWYVRSPFVANQIIEYYYKRL